MLPSVASGCRALGLGASGLGFIGLGLRRFESQQASHVGDHDDDVW